MKPLAALRAPRALRHTVLGAGLLSALAIGATLPSTALAQGTVRIGMTASDIPLTSGAPNSGFEGVRFTGMTLYDALVSWDLSSADRAGPLVPQLATEWSVS